MSQSFSPYRLRHQSYLVHLRSSNHIRLFHPINCIKYWGPKYWLLTHTWVCAFNQTYIQILHCTNSTFFLEYTILIPLDDLISKLIKAAKLHASKHSDSTDLCSWTLRIITSLKTQQSATNWWIIELNTAPGRNLLKRSFNTFHSHA